MPNTKLKKKKSQTLNGRAKPLPTPVLGARQNIRLDDEMLTKVSRLAVNEERSVSQMLRILVREGLSQR